MATLDIVVLVVIAVGTVLGFMKGFIRQLASIVGLIAGLLIARALFAAVGERLAVELGTSVTFGQVLAFILIWLIVPITLSLFASMLSRMIDAAHMGCVNRWLGACLGAVKYALLTSMFIHFIQFVDSEDNLIDSTTKKASVLYYPMEEIFGMFIPAIKNVTKQLIDTDIICNKNPINM